MRTQPVSRPSLRALALAGIVVLLMNACTFSLVDIPGLSSSTSTPGSPVPTTAPIPSAEVTFMVALPTPLLQGETLYLSIVDEVTGLGLNPVNYAMQGMDPLHYLARVAIAMNSVVKYRYIRQGTVPVMEDDSSDRAVRYRMYMVTGPATVEDVVGSWTDSPFSAAFGRLTGQVKDAATGAPLAGIFVTAGGQQTLTDAGGAFAFEGLPAGTHTVAAYALDGSYQTFQQGARIEAGKLTSFNCSLAPAQMVSVTFTVSVPANTIINVPVRLAGNLYQLGNTFGDLNAGLNTIASRMPPLTRMNDGRYTLTMLLPAGADIRYKYTLGDGFWNAEHSSDGSFILREFIVPASGNPVQVQDVVQTWQAGPSSPILFEVSVPSNTPSSDIVSIQFNPFAWTEPIPMWPKGNNQWVYQLYSPLDMLGDFEYRYCRNDQCGIADDEATANGRLGRPVSPSLAPQDLQDIVSNWVWFTPSAPANLVAFPVTQRAAGFWAGVELQPGYDPTWQAWMPLAIQNVQGLFANTLVVPTSWTISRATPLIFAPVPGKDPLWADTLDTVSRARASNLNVALFPAPNFPSDAASWWNTAARDPAWWDTWFNRYQAFVDYYAELANKSGAQTLILGGDWLTPALPNGTLADGSGSGVPGDAQTRWDNILAELRQRFGGSILWAVSYPGGLQTTPAFASNLDGIYLLWYAPLDSTGTTVDNLRAVAGQLLDNDIRPYQAAIGKPVFIAAAYPSASGAASATLPSSVLFQAGNQQAAVNLQTQTDIYQALMLAVNDRDWVYGFVSRGYYPPVGLLDASASVHSKPAADVLWYWYPRFLGIPR